jgi:hypothetical protein
MSGMRPFRSVLTGAVLLFTAFSVWAQDIDLVGDVGWQRYTKRLLAVFADEVANNRPAGFSGPLRLVVWATPEPSMGDFTDGYEIGLLGLGDLRGGYSIFDIDYLVRYISPPPGLYYTSITLEEFSDIDGWIITDYVDFEGIVNFGGVGQGLAVAGGSNGDLYFDGEVYWESLNGKVFISSQIIGNDRPTKSGPLRLTLTATETPFEGGVLNGPILAKKTLPRLKGGFRFENLEKKAKFVLPPEGVYYTVMTLEERIGRDWVIVDWITFPDPSIF